MEDLLFCSSYDCPYRLRHGRPAEYSPGAERCSDCGAPLQRGTAPTVKEAAELGAPLAEPLLLNPSPIGAIRPVLVLAGGALLALLDGMGYLTYFGASLLVAGLAMLRHRRRNAPRILPHEHGFVVVVGDERIAFPSVRLTGAQVTSRELRVAGLKLGQLHDLTLIVGTQRKMFTGFSRGGTAPFLDFARALSARSTLR